MQEHAETTRKHFASLAMMCSNNGPLPGCRFRDGKEVVKLPPTSWHVVACVWKSPDMRVKESVVAAKVWGNVVPGRRIKDAIYEAGQAFLKHKPPIPWELHQKNGFVVMERTAADHGKEPERK